MQRFIEHTNAMDGRWSMSISTGYQRIPKIGRGNHLAIDVCGRAAVQLDFDGGNELRIAMYGTKPIELHVQRTVKRADVWAL